LGYWGTIPASHCDRCQVENPEGEGRQLLYFTFYKRSIFATLYFLVVLFIEVVVDNAPSAV
jgi:hypothetical protein